MSLSHEWSLNIFSLVCHCANIEIWLEQSPFFKFDRFPKPFHLATRIGECERGEKKKLFEPDFSTWQQGVNLLEKSWHEVQSSASCCRSPAARLLV